MDADGEHDSALHCQRHPDRHAVASCASCDALVCLACRRSDPDGLSLCPACDAGEEVFDEIDPGTPPPTYTVPPPALPAPEPGPSPAPPPPRLNLPKDVVGVGGPEPLAWEQGDRYHTLEALGRTVVQAFRGPFSFMARIPWVRGDMRTPLVFALLCSLLGRVPMHLGRADLMAEQWRLLGVEPLVGALISLPMLPLVFALQILVESAVAHGLLRLVGAATRPYEATFRIYCYASVAAMVLMVPYIGLVVEPFLTVIFLLSGMRIGQQTTFGQALLGLVPHLAIPLLIGFGLFGGSLGA